MGCACDKSFFSFYFCHIRSFFAFSPAKLRLLFGKCKVFLFFHRGFFSSDDTEFIRRFPAATITHGFSRMRPVRSLQIPPEIGKSPTDFTDSGLVRPLEKSTQISQMTQILLLEICFFVPQISQIYTDSGLVRSLEKSTQISQMTQFFLFGYLGNFPFDYGKNESV